MPKKYDAVVVIGRFQPLHTAHVKLLTQASQLTDHVIVIVGSANQPRTFKNPWTSMERASMIDMTVSHLNKTLGRACRWDIKHNIDTIYNDAAWAVRVQELVRQCGVTTDHSVAILGHKKDETSFYLDMFPQWHLEQIPLIEPLNASNIRDLYFKADCNLSFLKNVVPATVYDFLNKFKSSAAFDQIVKEREFIDQYRKQYSSLPYEPTFVTADNIVVQSGHVLMIRRRAEPGRGLWALPGGFLNASTDRSMLDAAIRELKEETGLKVPEPVLRGSVKANRVFDAIGRSARGRTITHSFKYQLADGPLPKVKAQGADDADRSRWFPIGELNSSEIFEDHYEQIQWALGA